jgi:hypothetical protein
MLWPVEARRAGLWTRRFSTSRIVMHNGTHDANAVALQAHGSRFSKAMDDLGQ